MADAGYSRRAAGGVRRAATRVSGVGVGRPVGAGVWLVQAVGWRGRLVGSGGRLVRAAGWCGRLVGAGRPLLRDDVTYVVTSP